MIFLIFPPAKFFKFHILDFDYIFIKIKLYLSNKYSFITLYQNEHTKIEIIIDTI